MTNLLIAFGFTVILAGVSTMESTASVKASCIRITHIGEQDKPIPEIEIRLARRADARVLEDYKWEFRLRKPQFRKIEAFVLSLTQLPVDTSSKETPFGTFRVQWRLERGSGDRVVSRSDAGSFIVGLEDIARRLPNDALTEVLSGVLKRIGRPAK